MSVAVTTRGNDFYGKYRQAAGQKEKNPLLSSSGSEFLNHVQTVGENQEQGTVNETSADLLNQKNSIISAQTSEEAKATDGRKSVFDRIENGGSAPYSALADENGEINYNGIIFQVDYDNNAICLGDCSPGANYLTISLPDSGGCLKVNRDNYGDLVKAISMFSPRDRGAIIRAISTDSYCQRIKEQIEDEEDFTDLSNTETGSYSVTKDTEKGYIEIYDKKTGAGIRVSSEEDIIIQKDGATGVRMLINDYGGGFYTALQVTDELEEVLKSALHTDTLKETELKGFQIHTDEKTGIQYMTADGYESRGGSLLLDDEDRKKLLSYGEEYLTAYPEQISSLEEGIAYASFEVTGAIERTENGFNIKDSGAKSQENRVTKPEILVNAGGSRVLRLIVRNGDIQNVMNLELTSKEDGFAGTANTDIQKAIEQYIKHLK